MHLRTLLVFACALAFAAPAAGASRLVPAAEPLAAGDPLAFAPGQVASLERGAAFGHSHVLYTRSPGGTAATAARVARFRPLVDRAAKDSGFSPQILEAMVFLESAGRPDAIAGNGPLAASGLTQIMGGTANAFLGMKVNLYASGILTRKIARAHARGEVRKARRLEARRRQVDSRFAPAKALAATVRYLKEARGYLGRNDLAVASYHMGIGNLQGVLEAYGRADVPYARLYFDSAPDRNPEAWRRLSRLADDSRHYWFKVLAAKRIMHLYRTRPRELRSLEYLHAQKLSAEEVMHPASRTRQFARSRAIVTARRRGGLQPLAGTANLAVARELGEMARRVGRGPTVYRALRPEALATLLYISERVHELSGSKKPIVVTSAVRDHVYQRVLMRRNAMAARTYSLHTTGYAFDIARSWNGGKRAAAVQFVLDRLQSRGLIAYIKEPGAIHIAVSKEARILVPAMLRDPDAPGGIGEAVVEEFPPAPAPKREIASPPPPPEPRAEPERHWLEELLDRVGLY